MALLDPMVTNIAIEIPESVGFISERMLLEAIREFCAQTTSWRVDMTPDLDYVASQSDYTLTFPTDTILVDIVTVQATDGGLQLKPTTPSRLDREVSEWRKTTGAPFSYMLVDAVTIRLVYTPPAAKTGALAIRLAVKPTLEATTIDDHLYDQYGDIFVHGALSKLYRIPRKAWSDPGLAGFHLSLFDQAIDKARGRSVDENLSGIVRKVKYGGN